MTFLRKTSAGILRNRAETEHLDRLADTAKVLGSKTSQALSESAASRGNKHWSRVRDN